MSLKAFHLFFIIISILLAFGFAVWSFLNFLRPDGRGLDLAWGIGSVICGLSLIVYEAYFLKKTKSVSFL